METDKTQSFVTVKECDDIVAAAMLVSDNQFISLRKEIDTLKADNKIAHSRIESLLYRVTQLESK